MNGAVKWTRPEGEVIKVNVDAAIFEETGRYSYVCVARNNSGSVEEAISSCKEGRRDMESIHSKAAVVSYFGDLINDCRAFLEELPNVSLFFVRRSVNGVAHFLARASYYVVDRTIRSDDISLDIFDVIMKDY
ncbi:uncharacterized protein LOC141660615 [Apium graveolens]|uniref:uncharacterized protein LOC141660615 n=1 Tax=Apium graveolens TaxID=4045 RepID=UPI003D7BC5FF